MNLKIKWEKWTPTWDAMSSTILEELEDDERPSHVPLLMTASGPIPLQDIHPMKQFDFWTVHTNFPVSEDIAEMIDDTLGVEAFNILSPVRMRIAIGKLFDTNQIQMEIGHTIQRLYKEHGNDTE